MVPGKPSLEINGVRRFDRSVGGKLDGCTLYEGSCGHDNRRVVARHRPRLRSDKTVHRRGRLNSLAERDNPLRLSEGHCLNDIVARLRAVRNHGKSQFFIDIGCEYGSLQGPCHHRWREEQSLIEGLVKPQAGSYLTSQTRGGQAVGGAVDAVLSSGDISADRRQSAARILDERPHHHIRSHVGRLHPLHKLAVAVIHHTDDIRLPFLDKGDQLTDPLYRQGRPGGVPLGTLDCHQFRLLIDCRCNSIKIKASIRKQIHLAVDDPVLF